MPLKPELSVVVPILNEVEGIVAFCNDLRESLDALGRIYEVVIVDDGSTDGSTQALRSLCWEQARIVILARNYGHQKALLVGLSNACGKYLITMDGDGQHPPQYVGGMVETAESEEVDVVYMARRRTWKTPRFKAVTSAAFYSAARHLTSLPIGDGRADFRLITAQVRDELLAEYSSDVVLRVAIPALNFRYGVLEYDEKPREFGRTKYSLGKMMGLAVSFVFQATNVPLRAAAYLAATMALLTLVGVLFVVASYFLGGTMPGWASGLTATLFIGAALSTVLAIHSRYLAALWGALPRGLNVRVRRIEYLRGSRTDEVPPYGIG